jgi:hypothetical protein
VFAEIIAAAAGYEQSNRPPLRWERQFGYAAAQNRGICSQVPCRGRPSVNREYTVICTGLNCALIRGRLRRPRLSVRGCH